MRQLQVSLLLAVAVLLALPAAAQNPTGTLTGRVIHDNAALPGVTVIAESDALVMGSKTTVTGGNGDYIFRALPAGDYKVTFSLSGFSNQEAHVKISVAQTRQIDAVMNLEAVTEEITVTSALETIASSTQSSITYDKNLIESLPIQRNFTQAVLLAPGASNTGPRNGITIAGARANENLFMINGVSVNENIRGQQFDLFIEDAIQETTTSVSGVSAEYGRFSGGVVNMITRSGGNEFSGSFRVNLTNDDWNGWTPLTVDQTDKVNKQYEVTLGGFLWKERLWFFLAGRDFKNSTGNQTFTGQPFDTVNDQQRYEYKLTFSPHANHRLIGAYTKIDNKIQNSQFFGAIELQALDHQREQPQTLLSLNYTGVVTESFFVEAQRSEREFTFVKAGPEGAVGMIPEGVTLLDFGLFGEANTYLFCGDCPGSDEERNNEEWLLKGSLFVTSASLGTHDIVFGYDSFNDIRLSNNWQSPSNYIVDTYQSGWIVDGVYYPIIEPGLADISYWPIDIQSQGTDFTTNSIFVNDSWRFNDRLSFNIGFRYDENDGQNADGTTTADDSEVSPRIGATWDVKGDGDILVHASYGRYVAAVANGVADVTPAGSPSSFYFDYWGEGANAPPCINCDAPVYTSAEAIAMVFDWWESIGGPWENLDLLLFPPYIPGLTSIVPDTIKSPYADEISVGVTKRLGNKGVVRADYVSRDFGNFYASYINESTGQVTDEFGSVYDLAWIGNDDNTIKRKYDGLHTQLQYRLTDTLSLGANWTWSHTRGNVEGENRGSGPIASGIHSYPEYTEAEWNYPYGDLATDQRHRVRAWLVWEVFSNNRHSLSASLLQSFFSGTPYTAQIGGPDSSAGIDSSPYVTNAPDYATPPGAVVYFFEPRGSYHTDDITRTDISLNYSFFFDVLGTQLEIFLQPEIQNLFNEDGVATPNTAVVLLDEFDPFTETPVEGVNWRKGTNFGKATRDVDYQLPRTVRFSLGIRF